MRRWRKGWREIVEVKEGVETLVFVRYLNLMPLFCSRNGARWGGPFKVGLNVTQEWYLGSSLVFTVWFG